MSVHPVRTAADRRAFVRVPRDVRPRSSPWVRPLDALELIRVDPARNPYFREADVALFLARRDGTAVGRIAAHVSRRYRALHDDAGFFGLFDAADEETARALIDAAQSFVGRRTLRGPMSFTASQEMGLVV